MPNSPLLRAFCFCFSLTCLYIFSSLMHILRLQPKGTGVFTLSVKEARHFPKGKTEGQIRRPVLTVSNGSVRSDKVVHACIPSTQTDRACTETSFTSLDTPVRAGTRDCASCGVRAQRCSRSVCLLETALTAAISLSALICFPFLEFPSSHLVTCTASSRGGSPSVPTLPAAPSCIAAPRWH